METENENLEPQKLPNKKPKQIRSHVKENVLTGQVMTKEQATTELIQNFYNVLNKLVIKGIGITKAIKQTEGITIAQFYNIVDFDSQFREHYTRANELRAELINDKLTKRINDDSQDFYINDKGNLVPNAVRVQRDRLIYDATKFQLERMNPKKYGQSTTIKGDANNPLQVVNITGMIIE